MHPDGITLVFLTRGKVAIIDTVDAEFVLSRNWRADAYGYVITGGGRNKRPTYKLHRILMDAPSGVEVDHINRNKLNNRRCNLRLVTHAENSRNLEKRPSNTSGYKGVTWYKRHQKWRAYIRVNYRQLTIGHYPTPEEAALAYDAAAREHFGEFAHLNFPE